MNKFFDKFQIKITKGVQQTHEVEITTHESIYILLNFVIVYFGMISAMNDNDLDLSENLIEKIIGSLNIIDAVYYIRYVLSSKLLISKKLFENLKGSLEKPGIQLQYGNTGTQRLEYIKGLLSFDKPIIDVGCGEGAYALPFAGRLKKLGLKYYSIDVDEDELAKVSRKAKEKELDIVTLNSHEKLMEHLDWNTKYDVIMTEVVEHMGKEESQKVVKWVLDNVNFDRIIITTPNIEFNVNYMLGDQLRHDDHKWELTKEEFTEYVNEVLTGHNFNIKYLDIGDMVNNIATTQGVLITGSQ
jgi:2-polyprenyl-3-methyl-5-hydroxy-6-metoxy-1,4-benzoquinol methylase